MSEQSDIKYCRICMHVLPAMAQKCTKCGSWQKGLRAVMGLTDTSLSLMLAFISVMSVIVPPALRWIARESLTRVAIVSAEPNGDLQVAVSNIGSRPTVLRSYSVQFLGDSELLPRRDLIARNAGDALVMPEKPATIALFGAEKIVLPESRKGHFDAWVKTGVVQVTACVKESGSGVAAANLNARAGTCESYGLVSRTDSIAAIHLRHWIEGLVQWEPKREL